MRALRWLALPLAVLGLFYLFVALLWTAVIPLVVGVVLVAVAAAVWRAASGKWPSLPASNG